MKTPPRNAKARGRRALAQSDEATTGTAKHTASTPEAQRPYLVVVDGDRVREWGRYSCEAAARAACAGLRRVGFAARVLVRRDTRAR